MDLKTPEQKANISIEISSLMANEMKDTVSTYIHRYKGIISAKLGLYEDDLKNDIQEQIWKGLLTWDPNGKANKKTYLNRLIEKRFMTLLKRTTILKNNSLMYYADVFTSLEGSIDADHTEDRESGETLYQRRQELMKDLEVLGDIERAIFPDLLQGSRIDEMAADHGLKRQDVIKAINNINTRLSERRANTVNGAL